ncbi:TVG0210789 [Thermoplasma volcanium GSS1]|uniref:TVG0210789 protein n=1 Tax=Thermoplasma volcanium (strain ATCC 51530 / DSM 4299 / JCM 9571 / NBRC 15438 / GSS1) TaxID=273116 RepID=Q97C99_THEVO|nr:extracellular solute-binding protein [Thermoplasma volcanium]BAB59346.1 TVG0210789 [Thermoplasma volcanium GSS1]
MESSSSDIKPKRKIWSYIVIVVVLAAVIGGVVYYYSTLPHPTKQVTITVAAPVYSSSATDWENFINNATKSWQAEHPNVKVEFIGPLGASSEGQYYTKLDLLTSSSSTAPTVMLEDMFYTATYQSEGILAPLNSYINSSFFNNIFPSALGQMTIGGIHYGLPAQVTDTLIYYNITLLQKAGVIPSDSTTWQPTNWTEIINAAKQINSTLVPNDPGLIPLNIYEGVKGDEASSFTGFEGLLYGTGYGLYNFTDHKWYGYSPGLNETFEFYKTVFGEGLATPALSATPYITAGQYMQEGKLAIDIDGSWMYGYQWAPGAQHPISNFSKYIGVAKIPTYSGQAPGFNTMVGGWGWAMYNGTPSSEKPLVASFMMALDNTSNQILINEPGQALAGGLPTAKNAVNNPNFSKLMPTDPSLDTFFTNILKYGSYRPPVATYPKVSYVLQEVMGYIVSDGYSVSKAASTYNSLLTSAVGASNVMSAITSYTPSFIADHRNFESSQYNYLLSLYLNTSLLFLSQIFW